MATLADFREKYPQYGDVPDVDLANSLHQKFYADMPKMDFYKSLGLGSEAMIPGGVMSAPAAKTSDRSVMDMVGGILETPLAVASGLVGGVVRPIAGVVGELSSSAPQGSPEATAAGQRAMQQSSRGLFTPRTQTGQDIMGGINEAMQYVTGGLPMQPMGALTSTANALAAPAMRQAGTMVQQGVVPPVVQRVNALRPQGPQMSGGGAAVTADDLLRTERLQRFKIRSTLGARTKNLPQQQFESEVERGVIAGIPEEAKTQLIEEFRNFKAGQKRDILNQFERMTNEVVGEEGLGIDRSSPRAVGTVVDKALVKLYEDKLKKVDAAYQAARDSGETKQIVNTSQLENWLTDNAPEAISVPQIQTISEKLKALKKATNNQISIDDLENLYKSAGNLAEGNPSAALFMGKIKGVINDMTAGAGGDLYRIARTERKQLGKQFQDVARVDQLLSTKAGKIDRKVALDDVYNHVVVDGSLEEMRTVTSLLKKTPEGQKAYKELQGYTVQRMKDLLLKKGEEGDAILLNNFSNFVTQLDREDKLSYMFGKKGRDEILDLRNAIKDVLVKEPGAVNYSNTSGFVLRGLEALQSLRVPLAKSAAEIARTREVKGKVTKALQQPTNQLAPPTSPTNNLAP
jgi:hypothetical protein